MILYMLVVFVFTLFFGFPIFMSLGMAMATPSFINPSFVANGAYLFRTTFASVDNTVLLAIPLFLLSGDIMAKGGISRRLLDFFAVLVGERTAGMPIAVVLTSILYGAICGAGPAACAAVGAMAVPTLIRLGYRRDFAAALVGAGGGIGIIIPPSIPFVTYGMMTGVSVGAMFTAGFIPGFLIGFCIMVYIYFYCRIKGEDKQKIHDNYVKLMENGVWGVFKDSFWALLSPVIILGGIYTGVVTPTEAAVISVFYALFACLFIYKTIKPREIYAIMAGTVRTVSAIGLMLAFALGIGRVFTLLRVPQSLAAYMTTVFHSPASVIIAIIIVLLIIGMFMDVAPAVMIFAPLLLPVVKAFGFDPVHFGIILTVTISIGLISPPYGVNLFVSSALAEIRVERMFRMAIYQCLAYLVALTFITAFPQISLFLGTILK